MIKLMIVDDEAGIRNGLKHYIDWSTWDIALVAEASSADEALEKAAQHHPDILISDICMPGMDGLSLCKALRQQFPSLRIVLLSGYDNVDYLRAALAIGVQEYLLKPAGAESIISSVLKLKKSILEERDMWQRQQDQKALWDENFTMLQMLFVEELLGSQTLVEEKLYNKARVLNIPLEKPFYQTLKLVVTSTGDEYGSSHELDMDYWQLIQMVGAVTGEFENSFLCELAPQEYFILVNGDTQEQAAAQAAEFAQRFVVSIGHNDRRHVVVGIGTPAHSPLAIRQSYQNAEKACRASAWDENHQVFVYDESYKDKGESPLHLKMTKEYFTALTMQNTGEALAVFDRLSSSFAEARTDMLVVQNNYRQLLQMTHHAMSQPDATLSADLMRRIDAFTSGRELEEWMREQLTGLLVASSASRNRHSPLVEKALHYMEEHYTENITLQFLAKELFISPNYLGRIFHAETGFKQGEWLNLYRIECAKKMMLAAPRTRTDEVAELVGFNSYKYFSICFKKYAGQSLRDFRRRPGHSIEPLRNEKEAEG